MSSVRMRASERCASITRVTSIEALMSSPPTVALTVPRPTPLCCFFSMRFFGVRRLFVGTVAGPVGRVERLVRRAEMLFVWCNLDRELFLTLAAAVRLGAHLLMQSDQRLLHGRVDDAGAIDVLQVL